MKWDFTLCIYSMINFQAVQSEMIEAKPKINQLQRYTYYPKVSDVCKKWEDISNRIQVCVFLYVHIFVK